MVLGAYIVQPKINKVSEKLVSKARPNVAIEDLLHYKHREYQQRAKARELKKDIQEQMMREAPKMSLQSERILQEKQQYLDEAPDGDRLYNKPIGAVKQRVLETIEQPTFKPTISKKSREIVNSNMHYYYSSNSNEPPQSSQRSSHSNNRRGGAGGEVFYAASLVDDDSPYSKNSRNYRDNVNDQDQYYEDEDEYGYDDDRDGDGLFDNVDDATISLEQLAFDESSGNHNNRQQGRQRRPPGSRSKNSMDDDYLQYELPASQSHYGDMNSADGYQQGTILSNDPGFYSRSMRWQQDKEEKLNRERRQREAQEVAECSFKPSLDEKSSSFAAR
jgi:hypothetical protein